MSWKPSSRPSASWTRARSSASRQLSIRGRSTRRDRIRLEGLVRQAVQRFEQEDDEGRQEEFRQLLKSYMRFYSFVAQVVRLDDTGLEKLYSYAAWLIRLLPNREVPAGHRDHRRHDATSRLQDRAEGGRQRLTHGRAIRMPLTPIKRVRRQTLHGRRGKDRFLRLLSPSTTATARSSPRRTSFASSR